MFGTLDQCYTKWFVTYELYVDETEVNSQLATKWTIHSLLTAV